MILKSKYYPAFLIGFFLVSSVFLTPTIEANDSQFPKIVFVESGGARSQPIHWKLGIHQLYNHERRFSHLIFVDPITEVPITHIRILRDPDGIPIRASVGDFRLKFNLEPYSKKVNEHIDDMLDEIQMITYRYDDRERAMEILKSTDMYQQKVSEEIEAALKEFVNFLMKEERYFGARYRFNEVLNLDEMNPEDIAFEAKVQRMHGRFTTFASFAIMASAIPLMIQPIPGPGIAALVKAMSVARLASTYHELARQLDIQAGNHNSQQRRSSAEYVYLALYKVGGYLGDIYQYLNSKAVFRLPKDTLLAPVDYAWTNARAIPGYSIYWASNFLDRINWNDLMKRRWVKTMVTGISAAGRGTRNGFNLLRSRLSSGLSKTKAACSIALRATVQAFDTSQNSLQQNTSFGTEAIPEGGAGAIVY